MLKEFYPKARGKATAVTYISFRMPNISLVCQEARAKDSSQIYCFGFEQFVLQVSALAIQLYF